MQVVSSDGLHHFYDKISQKFVSTINGEHPDPSTGDITIGNFKTTEDLVTTPEQFTRRFVADGAGVAGPTSTAYITRLEGALELVGQVDEKLRIIDEYDLLTSINKQSFITAIDGATGTYIISAFADFPNSNFAIASALLIAAFTPTGGGGSSWSATYPSWFINGSIISDLNDYGLEINSEPVIAGQGYCKPIMGSPYEDASWDVLVNPSVWAATISKPGIYDFYQLSKDSSNPQIELYAINGEMSRGSNASYYGLTINGAPTKSTAKTAHSLFFRVTYTGIPNPDIDIEYVAPSTGHLETAKPISITVDGFNQFNINYKTANLTFVTDTAGVNTIISSNGKYICYCNAYKEFSDGYVAYHSGGQIENIMWTPSIPNAAGQSFANNYGTVIKDSTLSEVTFSEDGYIVVALSSGGYNGLCIHPKTPSQSINTTYKEYIATIAPDFSNIPDNGLAAVGNVRDTFEIIDSGYIYTQNIEVIPSSSPAYESAKESAINNNEPYECDGQNLYIIKKEPVVTVSSSYGGTPSYSVQPYGIEKLDYTGARPYYSATYVQDLSAKLQSNTLTRNMQSPALSKVEINGLRRSLIDIMYPIGSIYMSTNDISPEELWGGCWKRISNKFLLGASENGIDMPYYLGKTGGEAMHMLTDSELPAVSGSFKIKRFGTSSGTMVSDASGAFSIAADSSTSNTPQTTGEAKTQDTVTYSFGSGNAHNNMPPYLAVCIWQRIL